MVIPKLDLVKKYRKGMAYASWHKSDVGKFTLFFYIYIIKNRAILPPNILFIHHSASLVCSATGFKNVKQAFIQEIRQRRLTFSLL